MLFAFGPEDLGRFAIPIGVGIAVLIILVVPSFRRSIVDSFRKGKDAWERLRGKNKPGQDRDEGGRR